MTFGLPLLRLMWSVISWDTLERWPTLNHLWIREYSNTYSSLHIIGFVLSFSIMYEILWLCVNCSTGMEWTVPTILSWVRLTVLVMIIWWYYSVATPPSLDHHVYEAEMKFLWSAVSHSVHILCVCVLFMHAWSWKWEIFVSTNAFLQYRPEYGTALLKTRFACHREHTPIRV